LRDDVCANAFSRFSPFPLFKMTTHQRRRAAMVRVRDQSASSASVDDESFPGGCNSFSNAGGILHLESHNRLTWAAIPPHSD
jgi:hypothetical protein